MTEVSKLNANFENANRLIKEQKLRKEEWDQLIADRDRKMEETIWRMEENYARQMEEMKKLIEDMSWA